MGVSLQKGQKVSLSKEHAGLDEVVVGLGWDPTKKGSSIDCDAFAFMLKSGKLMDSDDKIYFGHKFHSSGAVNHQGDNLTGEGEGDDEQIIVKLSKVPADYDKIVIGVNIYMSSIKLQHFGKIANAFIRLVDRRTNEEMCKYDLSGKDYDGCKAVIFGELYRYNGEWKFSAIGEGTKDGSIDSVAKRYK